jgi:alkyldihydroxyacetonephosphate synthase
VGLGAGPGRHWLADRFRHPYLRDSLLDLGIATDTLETVAPWSRLPELARVVRAALAGAIDADGERVVVLCHVSHPYRDGSSLYFTFFFRMPPDADAAVARWAKLKPAATAAIVAAGGTLSHHHGVGSWHAPWYPREAGERGASLVRADVRPPHAPCRKARAPGRGNDRSARAGTSDRTPHRSDGVHRRRHG